MVAAGCLVSGCWLANWSSVTSIAAEVPADQSAGVVAESVASDPLEALKKRSASDRWQKIKETKLTGELASNAAPVVANEPLDSKVVSPTSGSLTPFERLKLRLSQQEEVSDPPANRPASFPEDWKVLPQPPRTFEALPRPTSAEMLPRLCQPLQDRWVVAAPQGPLAEMPQSGDLAEHSLEIQLVAGEAETPRIIHADAGMDIVPRPLAPLVTNTQYQGRLLTKDPLQKSIGFRELSEIRPFYDLEKDQRIRNFADEKAKEYRVFPDAVPFPERQFAPTISTWAATDFYHYPLYFEDEYLERYGHTYNDCLQPFVSIIRFTGQGLLLPYQMTLDPVCTPKYSLGYYRPGDCVPHLHERMPWNLKAAAVEAGVVSGLILLIP